MPSEHFSDGIIPIIMALITTNSTIFELRDNETLLEGLERTGHEVEYQCRSGYCGSCRLKITSGKVSYDNPPLAFVGTNEILPCCCCVKESITVCCQTANQQPDLFEEDLFNQYAV